MLDVDGCWMLGTFEFQKIFFEMSNSSCNSCETIWGISELTQTVGRLGNMATRGRGSSIRIQLVEGTEEGHFGLDTTG